MNTTFVNSEAYITNLSGNIVITTENYVITSDIGFINHKTNIVQLERNVKIKGKNFNTESDNGLLDYKKNTASIENNVHIITNGYTIDADKSTINNKTKIVDVEGNISSKHEKYTMNTFALQLNLDTEEMSSKDTYLCLNPKVANGLLDENLYVKVEEFKKEASNTKYKLYNCSITGCNKEMPHYHLFSKVMDIVTDKRIVFNNVTLYYNKNKIITLSKYVIPLDPRYNDERVIPKIGYNTDEGYYGKFFYPYNPLSKDFYGRLMFDGMTKKGIGLGLMQDYAFYNDGKMKGDFTYYRQFKLNGEKGNEEYSLNHQHKWDNLKLNLRIDGNTNVYDGEEDYKYASYGGTLDYTTKYNSTIFSFKHDDTTTDYRSRSNYLTFEQSNTFNKYYNFNLNMNYNQYYTTDYGSKKLSTTAYVSGKETLLDWRVFTQLYDDLGEDKNEYLGMEKKPEITLSSDLKRMNFFKSDKFNVNIDTSYSKLTLRDGENTDRTYLDMRVPKFTYNLNKQFSLDIDGRYRQYYYKKDMAKYALSTSPTLNYEIDDKNILSIDYNLQNPKGYSPVTSDSLSEYRYSNFKWKYNNSKNLSMELFSGYDFMEEVTPWENLYYKLKWKINNNFSTYLSTYYDLNDKYFGTLIGQFKYKYKDYIFELGARYNGETKKLSSAKALMNVRLLDDYYLQAYTSYDGINKEFDYIAGELLRRHHCYDTSLVFKRQTGYYNDTSIMLYIKLNLFPDTDEFRSAQNGQAITSDVGNLYY